MNSFTMSYTALYRKWRPTKFSEVLGQDAIVQTLQNQILHDRIGHAYLFSGTRGTGKTTMAKIFARAVNCSNPVNGSPCNECESCRAILSGASMNVMEIDAASNNGVDNIREIRDEVKYRPTDGKYRVYIIDEVHMLSTGAFNALLKTLEEPPEYVIFILATTDVQKIPITVLSRCQRYDFKRLTLSDLTGQITHLLQEENVKAEEKAISYIARMADGSSRDALSLLERCISFTDGGTLTYNGALDVLGAVDQTVFSEILRAVLHGDTKTAFVKIDEMLASGRELTQFVADFIWYLRNVMLLQTENAGEEVLGISSENRERMREEALETDLNQIMRYIRILSQLTNEMRYASSKRVLLELALLKMMQPMMEEDTESLKDRIRALESQVARLSNGSFVPKEEKPSEEKPKESVLEKEIHVSQATYEDYRKLTEDWPEILTKLSRLSASTLQQGNISVTPEGGLCFLFLNEFYLQMAESGDSKEQLLAVLKERYKKDFTITFSALDKGEGLPKVVLGNHIDGIEMEIKEQ